MRVQATTVSRWDIKGTQFRLPGWKSFQPSIQPGSDAVYLVAAVKEQYRVFRTGDGVADLVHLTAPTCSKIRAAAGLLGVNGVVNCTGDP